MSNLSFLRVQLRLAIYLPNEIMNFLELSLLIGTMICLHNGSLVIMLMYGFSLLDLLREL